jgi:hypothetical protein
LTYWSLDWPLSANQVFNSANDPALPKRYAECRPLAFMLPGGQVADCTAGAALLDFLFSIDKITQAPQD